MIKKANRKTARVRRHMKLRQILAGTTERPRLAVYRSNKHIYAQIIDDSKGHTLAAVSSSDEKAQTPRERAEAAATRLAKLAKEKGITKVVFDRGGYLYHGRVQQLADAARGAGLEF